MKLTLKHIGKTDEASVEIKGITVITGENNTGKSTVSRVLFSVLNSFHDIQHQTENARAESVRKLLEHIHFNADTGIAPIRCISDITNDIVSNADEYKNTKESELSRKITEMFAAYGNDVSAFMNTQNGSNVISRLSSLLCISDRAFLNAVVAANLNNEFNGQICNIFTGEDALIELQIKDAVIKVSVSNEGRIESENRHNLTLCTETVYLDSPFILNELGVMSHFLRTAIKDHRYHLLTKLLYSHTKTNVFEELSAKDKLEDVYAKISDICSGEIIQGDSRAVAGYRRKNSDKVLDIRNLSAGLKTFVIIKMLIEKGVIEHNGTVILEEPEAHLHPKWQVVLAEIIVLLQKAFNLHILLNTHSPYFLRAIQVFSVKYETADVCRYYLSESEGDRASVTDVTGNVDKIYSKLYTPLQRLEDELYSN